MKKTYVDAIRKRGSGYDVHLSVSSMDGIRTRLTHARIQKPNLSPVSMH